VLDHLNRFVDELRAVGLPISLSDKMSALQALRLVPLDQRESVENALIATLVKRSDHLGAFRAVFDIFFARAGDAVPLPSAEPGAPVDVVPSAGTGGSAGGRGASALGAVPPEDLAALLLRAVAEHDLLLLRLLAGEGVARYGGFQPGRPVGGTYYVLRTLRAFDLPAVSRTLADGTAAALARGEVDALGSVLRGNQHERDIEYFRKEVEAEVRRLVAADRGAEALARTLRKPLPEDLDFSHASGDDIDDMRAVMAPLSRRLAARLQRRRRRGRHGRLDFRATIGRSMAYGGVPAELRFHPPRPVKPELVVVADVSGSVASFARFTLQLLSALSSQFSKVRSFAFVDGLTEVTDLLEQADDHDDLVARVNKETALLWVDGHSDYGHAFRTLVDGWAEQFTHRTSVIILGDARNNYHAAEAEALAELAARVRHVFWLNPEPRTGWDLGDSIVSAYAPYCDEVRECRTLGQLREFVDALA
jgi:uncharacterized protein with von Willebrand factor type A (vWA) domain